MSKESYAELAACNEETEELPEAAAADEAATSLQPQNTARAKSRKIRYFLGIGLLVWVLIGLFAYMSGHVVVGPGGRGLTLVQSLYLMSQIISTTGYGDYVPRESPGQLFVVFHVLYAGLLITGLVTEVFDWFVDKQAEAPGALVHNFLADDSEQKNRWLRLWDLSRPVLLAALVFMVCIIVWAIFFSTFCDSFHVDVDTSWDGLHECEALPYFDAVYFGVVTFVTIGFGDITPKTAVGEAFAAFFSLVGIASYLNLVGAVTDSFLKVTEKMKIERLTKQELDQADVDKTGSVDLFEFTRFILTKFNVVEGKVFTEIKQNFQFLDRDSSGFLERRDVKEMTDHYEARKKNDRAKRASIILS